MNGKEQKVKLSSGEISYFVAGEGRPLLYLHPAGGVRWSVVLETLAKSHKLHVPVMPGYDGTPLHPGLDSMRGLGKLAGDFVDAVIRSDCDVIGHSFGGWVSLWLAAQRPELVDHLVLEASAGFRPKGVGGSPASPEALKKALYAHPEKLPPGGKTIEMEAANSKMRAHYKATRETDEELLVLLPGIKSSTLILQGTEDRVIPMESAQLLKTRIPNSFLIYIWDAAHALEIDQPERVLGVTESFLTRSESFIANWGTLAVNPG